MADRFNILDRPEYAPWNPDTGTLSTIPDDSTQYNVFIGYDDTGLLASSGADNVIIGHDAGVALVSGTDNIGIGSESLTSLTAASNNVAIGHQAGHDLTFGGKNVFVGDQAGYKLTIGTRNVAVGNEASYNATVPIGLTTMGYQAGYNATNAQYNTAIGYNAHLGNQTGLYNTVIGAFAGQGSAGNSNDRNVFVGYRSGFVITSGDNNTCLGYESGKVWSSGTGNVCIGYQVGGSAPTGTSSNQLFIDNADNDEDNVIVYGEMDNHVMKLNADVRITEPGVETADPEGQLDVIQTDTAGAQPVIVLDQDDVSEEFIKLYGSAASATLTQSFVDVGDVTSAVLKGYFKINVQDEGNQITDGAYYVPFYTLS